MTRNCSGVRRGRFLGSLFSCILGLASYRYPPKYSDLAGRSSGRLKPTAIAILISTRNTKLRRKYSIAPAVPILTLENRLHFGMHAINGDSLNNAF